jgi:hypothetical protein
MTRIDIKSSSLFFLVVLVVLSLGNGTANAQLPSTGYVNSYGGVQLAGECVPNARKLGQSIVRRTLPLLGANGVAADLWVVNTPGFAKMPRLLNGQVRMPPVNSFIVWSRQLGGTGHVAMVIGSVNGVERTVRVVDTNWGLDGRGQIHDISVNDARILGYLVWQ